MPVFPGFLEIIRVVILIIKSILGLRFTKIISVYHIADRNFFKSCLVKWLLSEEEGRETETLCLLSVYTASWSSVP